MKNGRVELNGTDMYYASFGHGDRALVVLPGLSDGLATVKGKAWLLSLPYRRFFDSFTVYMFSRKNTMQEGITIRQMAEDQAQAMEALGIEKASVMGVSQGGMVAQYLAIDHPEMVEKLVLTVTAPFANDVIKDAVTTWIGMAEKGDQLSLMTDTAERMYSEAFLKRNRKTFPLVAKITKPASYERFFRNAYAILDFDSRDELQKISCPTLIIAGAEDKTVGTDAVRELNEMIPDSRTFVYEGLGHGAYEEAKDYYDRVLDFLK